MATRADQTCNAATKGCSRDEQKRSYCIKWEKAICSSALRPPCTSPSSRSSSLSLVLVTFAVVYLRMKQGEMIRVRDNQGYKERQPHQRNKNLRVFNLESKISRTAALSHSPPHQFKRGSHTQ